MVNYFYKAISMQLVIRIEIATRNIWGISTSTRILFVESSQDSNIAHRHISIQTCLQSQRINNLLKILLSYSPISDTSPGLRDFKFIEFPVALSCLL